MKTLIAGSSGTVGSGVIRHLMVRRVLLICGILAALIYVGSDILAATRWEGYSYTAQSVSELRAIGAPTRSLLMPVLFLYAMLEFAFGVGVWMSAGRAASGSGSLRIAGGFLIILGVLDLIGLPLFQLNLNEAVGSLVNTLHLVVTAVNLLLLLLIIGFGATANGKWFRLFSYAILVVFIVTGVWSFLEVPRIAASLPTPWLGVRERIGIYGYMLWLAVLAFVLWRASDRGRRPAARRHRRAPTHAPSTRHLTIRRVLPLSWFSSSLRYGARDILATR